MGKRQAHVSNAYMSKRIMDETVSFGVANMSLFGEADFS